MKKNILLSAFCIVVFNVFSQRTTNEQPYGMTRSLTYQEQDVVILTSPDIAKIEMEDMENDKKTGPVRYGYPVHANLTFDNSGVWQKLNDGSIVWLLKVNIPGALSTNTYYDKLWLPEGAKFFVYSEETKQSIGALTSDIVGGTREEPAEFATALIYGENVTFEYYQPASVIDNRSPIISITRIDYGYRFVDNPYFNNGKGYGDAGNCQVNVNCPEGNNWKNEKNAVAKVSIPFVSGSQWCS